MWCGFIIPMKEVNAIGNNHYYTGVKHPCTTGTASFWRCLGRLKISPAISFAVQECSTPSIFNFTGLASVQVSNSAEPIFYLIYFLIQLTQLDQYLMAFVHRFVTMVITTGLLLYVKNLLSA